MNNKCMRVAAYWYPVTVFGPGKKLGIWFQGCSKRCENCISPEYQAYDTGMKIKPEELLSLFEEALPEGLIVSGGEPFDQPEALYELVRIFSDRYSEDIIVYTGYRLEELEKRKNPIYKKIIDLTAVLIDGVYVSSKNTGLGLAGSKNQRIYVRKMHEKYENADKWERKMMCVMKEDSTFWMIGVPPTEI